MQNDPGGKQKLLATISQLVGEQSIPLSAIDRDGIAKEVLDEVFGLGPLEPLLHDPSVSDILVNTLQHGLCRAPRNDRRRPTSSSATTLT